ncbi:NAD(P)/FAD-dependent oxidoreductase [Neolewinella persica]|uniref:NAD(P)/FAD-dependent oxidoreductase n=1 Tax=Neolewinella persica TaxID=70998 RepID=UPI000361D62F|nr:FAD-dependent oxidoreductase [Neolewinella persica]
MPRSSYWEQTTFLRSPDVAIIGAGLTGLQAALELKRRQPDLDVLVMERAAIPRGASTRNAGFACFGGPTELLADLDAYGPESMADTVRKRFAGIKALEKNFAHRDIDWVKDGGYEVIDDAEIITQVRNRLPELNALLREVTGLEETWVEVTETNFLKSWTDHAAPPSSLLLHNPLEAQLHPGKLVTLLLNDCHRAGIRFLFGGEVESLEGGAAGAVKIRGAAWGTLHASQVLVTVNAFARKLLPTDFPEEIRPVRNQILLSDPLPDFKLRGCYHYHEGYVYFRNVGNDRLLIGGARHKAGASSETDLFGPNGVPEAYLLEKLNEWFPGRTWTDADFPTRWSGIIAQGDGKSPVLRYASDNVLVAGRLAGMGVALSADLGRRAAEKLLETTTNRP